VPATESRRIESGQQARKEFGVNLVITGTLQRRGDQVRLTLSLTDVERTRQIDAEPIDWPGAKLWEIEDAVLVNLADLLNLVLSDDPQNRPGGYASHVPGAHDSYLRGRGLLYRYDRPGNVDRALQQFEDAAQRDPNFALAYVGMAETHTRIYRLRRERDVLLRARLAAERALQINPQLATAHVALGGIYGDLGQYEEAIRELESAIKLDTRDPAPYRELAVLHYRLGRYPEADEVYAKAIKQRPGDWLTYRSAASYFARTQRLEEAEKYFRKVIELTPDNHEGYRNLGGVLLRVGRQKEAEQALIRAQNLNPTATALANLGFLYMQQRRYDEAVQAMEQASDLAVVQAPAEFLIWGNLGDAYWLAQTNPEKAKQAWRRAAAIARGQILGTATDAERLSYLAKFEAKAGDLGPALQHIEEALKYGAQNGTVRFQAAIVYTLLDQKQRAFTELAAAVKRNYPIDEIQQAPELATLRGDPGYSQALVQPPTKP
jgi:serine/threonine-protein kinase